MFFGIKDDILDQLTSCQENRRVLIAEGKLPEPGKPGKLIEKTTDKKSEDSKRKKNYYHRNIFSVLPGEVIAKKIAPIPGKKGKTVQGQKISPPSVEDIKLKLGNNVLAGDRGKKIISKIAGRPEIIKSNKQISIDVVPQHVVDGNVGRKTGILEFTGDLIVNGGIDDFFGVDIGGSLLVKRGINEAEIKCKNDVLVGKNIIGSKITVQNNQNQGSLIGSYIQNSELKIPGDVLLMGQGGYTSQIKAGGNIVCAQKRGFLKSGRYHAEGWLATGQLGAPMSKTEIFVGQGLLVYEIKGAVNVRSPRDRRRLEENQKRIFLKVNKEGKLELKAWPDWQKMLLKMQNDKLIEHWRQFKY
ncbi:MAG: flagellar assembly protein A [Halanaerobiaceae bacterium]